jgi:cell division protein ZapB
LFILAPTFMGPPALESEIAALEERIQRLLAAYQQARLERRRALQERDRLVTLNNELRKRIEGVITRIKTMEQAEPAE